MKRIATMSAASVAMAFSAAASYAQVMQMPNDAPEAGFDDVRRAVPLTGPVGGTIASEAGGVVQIGGDSRTGLVSTPDSDPDTVPTDD